MFDYTVPKDLRCSHRTFGSGEYILNGLEENNSLYLLTEGSADVVFRYEDGEDIRVYRYTAPDFFGEIELLSDRRQPLPVIAAAECRVAVIPKQDALIWLRRDFEFAQYVMKRLCEKMYDNMYKRTELRFMTQRQRLLLSLMRHRSAGDLERLSKSELCAELGIPLRSLNRVIAQCADKVVYKNKHFHSAE